MDAGSRGNGNVTEWQRDAAERVTKEVQADGTFETHAYDFSGRLVATVDPMGRAMTLEHALDNRVTQSALARPDTRAGAQDAHGPAFPPRSRGRASTKASSIATITHPSTSGRTVSSKIVCIAHANTTPAVRVRRTSKSGASASSRATVATAEVRACAPRKKLPRTPRP